MKRLHVIASVSPASGGPIEGIKQMNAATAARGHTAEIASLDDPDAEFVAQCPLPVHALGPGRGVYGYTPRLVPWLKERAGEYDAVVLHDIWQFSAFGGYRALRALGKPYIAFTHGMLDPYFKRRYPLKHVKKLLYWRWGLYPVLRDAAAVCFTSEEERILACQSFRPYRCREVVINYGTGGPPQEESGSSADEQRAAFFAQWPRLQDKRILLYLSRIDRKKGCDLLLKAFAQVAKQDSRLHLVMAGPDKTGWRGELEALAQGLGLAQRVTWTGMVTGDAKWGAYRAAEAFALPSHQENFGLVVAEALSCGVPVLISDKVNIWREIRDAGAGLVEEDTPEGITRLLCGWEDLPAQERAAMREQAVTCYRENFTSEKAANSFIRVLTQMQDGINGGS